MRHMLFAASFGAALCLPTMSVIAQSVPPTPPPAPVPGRALLDFPLGTIGEIPALAVAAGGGLFNPATILPLHPARLSAGLAALSATENRGVDGQLGTMVATRGLTAVGVSYARVSVGGSIARATPARPCSARSRTTRRWRRCSRPGGSRVRSSAGSSWGCRPGGAPDTPTR